MALEAKEIPGVEHLEAVADQGYYHGQEVKTCLAAGVIPYAPRPITSANEEHGLFTKDDFTYTAAQDAYECPGTETLTFRFETTELGRRIRYYSTPACKQCPFKTRCTRNQQSRRITRCRRKASARNDWAYPACFPHKGGGTATQSDG